ncbi:SANT/Myb_domain [Hexamita inflata]|uniref:SANT/Myb domain n=1 Tax=Hexamita inflata TaxID=28002 RepID=A0AA86R5Q4_9EUKA|nr:SANT/Myb domain [Hexamita inflata]
METNVIQQFTDRSKRTWTQAEQEKFKHLYKSLKRDFKQYVPYFDGRTEGQIKSFYQNVVHKNKIIQKYKDETLNTLSNTSTNLSQIQSSQELTQISDSLFEYDMISFENFDQSQ